MRGWSDENVGLYKWGEIDDRPTTYISCCIYTPNGKSPAEWRVCARCVRWIAFKQTASTLRTHTRCSHRPLWQFEHGRPIQCLLPTGKQAYKSPAHYCVLSRWAWSFNEGHHSGPDDVHCLVKGNDGCGLNTDRKQMVDGLMRLIGGVGDKN